MMTPEICRGRGEENNPYPRLLHIPVWRRLKARQTLVAGYVAVYDGDKYFDMKRPSVLPTLKRPALHTKSTGNQ